VPPGPNRTRIACRTHHVAYSRTCNRGVTPNLSTCLISRCCPPGTSVQELQAGLVYFWRWKWPRRGWPPHISSWPAWPRARLSARLTKRRTRISRPVSVARSWFARIASMRARSVLDEICPNPLFAELSPPGRARSDRARCRSNRSEVGDGTPYVGQRMSWPSMPIHRLLMA